MNAHDERHELAIERWLTDDGPAEREAAQTHAAQCHECAERLAELRTMTAVLDGMQRERDEILALAQRAPKSPRADVLVAAARAGFPLPQPLHAPRRLPHVVGAALAVAALITVAFVLGRHDGASNVTPTANPSETLWLGGEVGSLRPVAPSGDVSNYGTFEWNGVLADGETFTLVIRDATKPGRPHVLPPLKDLTGNTWSPGADLERTLPSAIEWEVRVEEISGKVRPSQPLRARRPAS